MTTPIESALATLVNKLQEHREQNPHMYSQTIPLGRGRGAKAANFPHLVFADALSDAGDLRAAIVRSHFAQRLESLMSPKKGDFGWRSPTDTRGMVTSKITERPLPLRDGTHLMMAIAHRFHPKGHVEYAPIVSWLATKHNSDSTGFVRQAVNPIAYQAVLPVTQARQIIEQHAADPHTALAVFDEHFAATPQARQKTYGMLANAPHELPLIPTAKNKLFPTFEHPTLDNHPDFTQGNYRHATDIPERYSRWTGQTHPMFTPEADGPAKYHFMSDMAPSEVLRWFRTHVHPAITHEHIAALSGWVPGAETTVQPTRLDGRPVTSPHEIPATLAFHTSVPDLYERVMSVTRKPGGGTKVYNDLLEVPTVPGNPYRGITPSLYLRQMRAAHEVGIPKVNYFAAWVPSSLNTGRMPIVNGKPMLYTGGLHWPLIGGDGVIPTFHPIPRQVIEAADLASGGQFSKTRRIQHLFASPEGKQWYIDNPVSHDGELDTAPGSYSRLAIERHVNEASAKHGLSGAKPDKEFSLQLSRHRKRLHPMLQHLIDTGSLHPEHIDAYFT